MSASEHIQRARLTVPRLLDPRTGEEVRILDVESGRIPGSVHATSEEGTYLLPADVARRFGQALLEVVGATAWTAYDRDDPATWPPDGQRLLVYVESAAELCLSSGAGRRPDGLVAYTDARGTCWDMRDSEPWSWMVVQAPEGGDR